MRNIKPNEAEQTLENWVLALKDILKIDKANKLNSYDEKYHVYDYEFGRHIENEDQRKKRGIFYAI